MTAFSDDWDTDLSSDSTDAIQIDDYINKTRTDIEERLKNWVYGFVQGENDDTYQGLIYCRLKQATDPTTPTDGVDIYCKDVGGNNEVHFDDEAGNGPRQITNAGALNVLAGDYAANSVDEDDIQLSNDAALQGEVAATGSSADIIGLNTDDVPELADGAVLAAATEAADDDLTVSDKKYVEVLAPQCWVQFASDGTIQGTGYNITSVTKSNTGVYDILWDTDFADDDYAVVATCVDADDYARITSIATTGCTIETLTDSGANQDCACCVIAIGTQ